MAEGAWLLRQRVRYGTAKDQRLTELTILSTAREISNQYEFTAHEPLGRAAGLEQEIMDFVKYRRPLAAADGVPGMGETEKLIIQFTRELISEPKVSAPVFAPFRRHDPEGIRCAESPGYRPADAHGKTLRNRPGPCS
jgi:4-carboxymuconolactone decarboxylase